jgi:hypothetical protein
VSECVVDHGTTKNGEKRRAETYRGQLCKNHSFRLSDWLQDVAVDYVLLATLLAPPMSQALGETHSGGGDESAAPVNLAVVALRDAERGGSPRERGDELWYELPDIPSVISTLHMYAEEVRAILDPSHEVNDDVWDLNLTTEVRLLLDAFDTFTGRRLHRRRVHRHQTHLDRAATRPQPARPAFRPVPQVRLRRHRLAPPGHAAVVLEMQTRLRGERRNHQDRHREREDESRQEDRGEDGMSGVRVTFAAAVRIGAFVAQVQPRTVEQWIHRGLITKHPDGYDPDEILTWIANRDAEMLRVRAGVKRSDTPDASAA